MNILLLNWRDPKNPKAGGAEKLNMQILNALVEKGNTITWYATAVKGLSPNEMYKGVRIIRFGSPLVHLLLWPILYWMGKLGRPDMIIDSIHGVGYLSSVFAPSKKKIILICEVAQNIWDEMYSFPVNLLGKMWEKKMFKFYRNNKFWTISESTKKDLITFGISKKNITIIPMGFDGFKLTRSPNKSKKPFALFVGRLAEMKGVKDAILAISEVNKNSKTKWRLGIIGRGESIYEKELKEMVSDLNLKEYITFHGFVPEKIKFEEMGKAWVLLVPSSREGWGMIVPEANYVNTQVVGYEVPGLQDVLKWSSSQNIIIQPGSNNIINVLRKISTPATLKKTIKPGWESTKKFVQDEIC